MTSISYMRTEVSIPCTYQRWPYEGQSELVQGTIIAFVTSDPVRAVVLLPDGHLKDKHIGDLTVVLP